MQPLIVREKYVFLSSWVSGSWGLLRKCWVTSITKEMKKLLSASFSTSFNRFSIEFYTWFPSLPKGHTHTHLVIALVASRFLLTLVVPIKKKTYLSVNAHYKLCGSKICATVPADKSVFSMQTSGNEQSKGNSHQLATSGYHCHWDPAHLGLCDWGVIDITQVSIMWLVDMRLQNLNQENFYFITADTRTLWGLTPL